MFAVIHGSAPIFNVQDQLSDVRRAVRFIRHRAAEFGIDGQRLGISGSSAGGLLALVVAMQEQDEIRPPTIQWNANLAERRPSAAFPAG